jgi:hypothetical protein
MTTVNLQVNASADDAYQNDVDDVSITVGSQIVDDPARYFGHRWSVPVPQGATINSADFIPYISNGNTDEPAVETYSEANDDAAAFVAGSGNENISLRTPSSATHVEVESADLGVSNGFFNMSTAITNGATYGGLVQAVVNRAGWVSGNHLVFITRQKAGFSGARDFGVNMYDLSTAQAAKLDMDYTGGVLPPVERSLGTAAGLGTAVAAARHAIHSRIVSGTTLACSSAKQSNVLIQRLVAELIRAADSRSRRTDASRTIVELVAADDVIDFRTQLLRTIVDALGCGDDANATTGLIRRLVAEEFGTSDDSMLAVEWLRRTAELLCAADEADRAVDTFRRLLDDLGIADDGTPQRVRGNIWPGDTTVAPLGPGAVRTADSGPGQTHIQGKLLND